MNDDAVKIHAAAADIDLDGCECALIFAHDNRVVIETISNVSLAEYLPSPLSSQGDGHKYRKRADQHNPSSHT
jgi:hypothetical protein